jgi:hypothetical protein
MPTFPNGETDVFSLAIEMVSGLTAHPADFPNVDGAALSGALNGYQAARTAQTDASGQAQVATATKNTELGELIAEMKKAIKQAEVDTVTDPSLLTEIGWGPKATPTPITAPGQPMNFKPLVEGPGTLELSWERPEEGGPVRNYILQRRDANEQGEFGDWQLLDLFYDTLAILADQPRTIELEYRVKAMNPAGESLPSNTATVVL